MSARRDDVLDISQFKALVRLAFWNTVRPSVDKQTGRARTRPIRTVVIAYGVIGLLFVRNAIVFRDLRSYLIAVASYVMTTATLTVLPDTTEMERRFEVICAKPIGARTMALARATSTLIMQSILVMSLAACPLAAVSFTHGAPIIVPLLLLPLLLAGCFGTSTLWATGMMVLSSRLRLDRLRWASQVLLGIAVLGLSMPLLLPRGFVAESVGEIDLGAPWVRLLPPAWIVDAVLGDMSLFPSLERGVLLVLGLAVAGTILKLGGGTAYMEMLEHALRAAPLKARLPGTARFLRRTGARILSQRTRAIATLILAHGARDEVGRRRLFPLRMMLLLLGAFDAFTFKAGVPVTTILGFLILVDGVRLASQSPHSGASWLLESAPLQPKQALTGLRVAIHLAYFSLPFVVTTALLFAEHALLPALLSAIAYALEADIVLSIAIALDPAWPVSREEQRMPPILGRFAYMIAFAVLVGVRTVLMNDMRAMAIDLAVLALVGFVLRRWSARRFARALS